MHKTITPSKIPKAIGLSVGLILSILFLPGDMAYAAGTRTLEPRRPVETRKEYYGDPSKSREINKELQDTFRPKFGQGAEKEKEKLQNIFKPLRKEEQKGIKPEPPRPASLPAKTPESKSVSKEVSREFESLGIEEICEDKTPKLSPSSVEAVQRLLNDLTGSKLKVDGQLGPLTREAIHQFQLSRGLSPNGTVDTQTARQLIAETVIQGETMFHIAVSSDSKQPIVRIRRSSNEQTQVREGLERMTRVNSIEDLVAYVGDGPSKLSRTQIERSSGKGVREMLRRRSLSNAWHDEHRLLFISGLHGADLPAEWKRDLEAQGFRTVRISDQSPKKTLRDHARAANLVFRNAGADMKILSALPRAGSESEMRMKLRNINLSEHEMSRWLRNSSKLDEFERWHKEKIFKEVSKHEVLEELSGDSHITFLTAHLDKEDVYLSTGEKISGTDIDGLARNSTNPRIIILLVCGAGDSKSLGERLIANGLADLVVAPPGLVSAEDIPIMVRQLLFERRTMEEVFSPDRFQIWGLLEAVRWVS